MGLSGYFERSGLGQWPDGPSSIEPFLVEVFGGPKSFFSSQAFPSRTLDVGYPVEAAKLDYRTSFKSLSPYMLWNF
jgi:hypothetical protein